MSTEDVYLLKYLETLGKELETAKAERIYLQWLLAEKDAEIESKEASYEKLGDMLHDRGLVEKKL